MWFFNSHFSFPSGSSKKRRAVFHFSFGDVWTWVAELKKVRARAYMCPMDRDTQIKWTRAESQQIVAQGTLSCLQYPVPYLGRLQRICLLAIFELVTQRSPTRLFVAGRNLCNVMILGTRQKRRGLFVFIITRMEQHITAFQHGFGLRGVQPYTYTW